MRASSGRLSAAWLLLLVLALAPVPALAGAPPEAEDLTALVDPLIGTAHSRWFHFAPGALPFGMAKPGPSTNGSYGNPGGWEAVGYDVRHESIEGFANFHEFQVGGVVFAAITGPLQTVPGPLEDPEAGYRSRFDRADETATAGYYSVRLKDYGIRAEVTATPRVAFHRYTFPKARQAHLLFDIGNRQGESGRVRDARVTLTPDGRVEGFVTTLPAYVQKYQPGAEVTLYFSAVLDKRPTAVGTFHGATVEAGSREATGPGAGLYLSFGTRAGEAVTIRAGLSYTSVENARRNLEAEAAALSFDEARRRARDTWNDYLGRIRVEGPSRADRVKFYTGLYHALLGRGLASDVSGDYPRHDGSIGRIPAGPDGRPLHNHYNTDAMWGGYWNLTQVWALAYPEYYSDFVKSQLLIYRDAGWLADGIAASRFVSGVGTNMMPIVFAGAYQTGIRDFDVPLAYEASLKNEIDGADRPLGAGKVDVDRFVRFGYADHREKPPYEGAPDEAFKFSGSHTLEYAFSSWAVAEWAAALGRDDDWGTLMRLSRSWEHLFDPETRFIRPRYADGRFIENFRPSEVWRGFQEGNAWQYTFFVPHDPAGLVARLGGEEFNARLDSIFTVSRQAIFGGGRTVDAFAGLEGLYNHGNQPNLHISWLFNFSGRPSLTQKWVQAICDEFYGTEGIHGYGFGQDEDQGQLGAWYVVASIGLFDVKGLAGRDPAFGLGAPLFDRVTIRLSERYHGGGTFVIETRGDRRAAPYVGSYTLDGERLHAPFLPFARLARGGRLVVERTATPTDTY